MRKLLFMFIMSFIAFACGNNSANAGNNEGQQQKDRVEILYFHGKQRCATCLAIEKNTKEAIESQFADELKKGTVVFRIIDISKKENEKIADKYEVTWSSLFVCKWKGGKEKYENMTEFAFGNARKSPDVFKAGVVKSVNEMLK
jgi:hypothetical protein